MVNLTPAADPRRLEFLTRHFGDLQTIRFAPVPAAMLLAVYANPMPHLTRSLTWGVLLGFLLLAVGFYSWTTGAIRRRYGSVRLTRDDVRRMSRHPLIIALNLALLAGLLWFRFFAPETYFWDWYMSLLVLIVLLIQILDSTNLASRRIAWATGLIILFAVGPFLLDKDRGAAVYSLTGAVWLSLSIFDFLLLRRTFAETSAPSPGAATDVFVRHG